MKRLLLMRHAEAAWESRTHSDLDRRLTPSGERAAAAMGNSISERNLQPQALVCSPALRALRTAELFLDGAKLNLEIRLDERIYEATTQTLYIVASEFDDSYESVMMVGHNPGFEGFIALLTGILTSIRPGTVAVVDLQIDKWIYLEQACGQLADFTYPTPAK